MPRNVQFSDEIIAQAGEVAPAFEFSKFAQAAVREKVDRERIIQEKLKESE